MNWAVAGQCGFVSPVFVVDGQVSMIVEEYLLGVLCSFFPTGKVCFCKCTELWRV